MTEKQAYAFFKPCGHAALLVADYPEALNVAADDIKWALRRGYVMKHVDVARIHDGTIRMCHKGCQEADQPITDQPLLNVKSANLGG